MRSYLRAGVWAGVYVWNVQHGRSIRPQSTGLVIADHLGVLNVYPNGTVTWDCRVHKCNAHMFDIPLGGTPLMTVIREMHKAIEGEFVKEATDPSSDRFERLRKFFKGRRTPKVEVVECEIVDE